MVNFCLKLRYRIRSLVRIHNLLITHKLWSDFETVQVGMERSGHGGGDKRLHDQVFEHPDKKDPYDRAAGLRDGAMSVLIGVAARKSIESGKPVRIEDLTDIELMKSGRGIS